MWWTWAALAAAGQLTGTYRADLHLVHEVAVPVLGRTHSDSFTVQLWRIDADGTLRNEHCSISASPRRRIGRPTIPQAFARAIPHAEARVQVDGEQLRVDMGPSFIGFDGTELPDGPEHPAVVDHEGDGKPGATMSVWAPFFGEVELYVAQRTHVVFEGRIEGDGVVGKVRQIELSQRTLDAANRLFVRNPDIRPLDEESRFSLRPVPASTTCDDESMAPVTR
jgi:hypothetical protein